MINPEDIKKSITTPHTYQYNSKNITIIKMWVDGDAIWSIVEVEDIDLGHANPFGFHGLDIYVETGEYERQGEELVPIKKYDPELAFKKHLDSVIDWIIGE